MKFSSAFLSALVVSVAQAVTLSFDQAYDVASSSLATVACSDGPNGMLTKGFTTFGSLPSFPRIGGAAAIPGFNSPNCGTCWQLTYTNSSGVAKSIDILAIDHTDAGFNIGLNAMNTLTNNQAVFLGRVDVVAKQVAASVCGLN
ncbi:Cerato-platanin [Mycena floridula]|nr:Cerato-platanin [Mycena floridula]